MPIKGFARCSEAFSSSRVPVTLVSGGPAGYVGIEGRPPLIRCLYGVGDSPTPVMKRRNEATTALGFFLTSGWDTHLQKYTDFQHLLFFSVRACWLGVHVPTTVRRELCDGAAGAEGPLGAAVGQSCRVAGGNSSRSQFPA